MGSELIAGSGTINPAALNSSGMTYITRSVSLLLIESVVYLLNAKYLISTYPSRCMNTALFPMANADRVCVTAGLPPSSIEPSPRGIKRSRSPDQYGEIAGEEDVDGTWSKSGGSDAVRVRLCCQTAAYPSA